MTDLFNNPWVIAIGSGIITGIVLLLIRRISSRKSSPDGKPQKSRPDSSHIIEAKGDSKIIAGNHVVAGDIGKPQKVRAGKKKHRITASEEGAIEAGGSVISGDSDSMSHKDEE